MLIDLLSLQPGQQPNTGSVDKTISGSYKSYGNLVSLKVDVIDCDDFQHNGCLANPGPGTSQSHNHNISGTLVCSPDTNTVRLNITILGPSCSEPGWPLASPPRSVESKTSVSWPQSNTNSLKEIPYSVYSAPVSPPSLPQDVPPPLLDFGTEQLMSDIETFSMSSDLQYSDNPPVSLPAPLPSPQARTPSLQQQQQQTSSHETGNHLVNKPYSVSPPFNPAQSAAKSPVSSLSGLPSSPVSQPCLLQPKLERSDSICSEYTPLKEEFLTYTEELCGGNLDNLEHDTDQSVTPPHNLSSPLLFSPSQSTQNINNQSQQEKSGIFFNKSFESKHQTTSASQNEAFDNLFSSSISSPKTPTSQTLFNNGNNTFSVSLQASPKPYLLSHTDSPQPLFMGSPSSNTSSSETHETPVTLLTSPKSRNRRNSSFDETKPHVCPQCGARFTTKSNLGQHAKIHLAVKPFICEICSHGFTRAAHYESHVAKHKGLKTHRCEQCGESFARLDNLLRHSARHKHGKIFDCTLCGKGFHRKDKLLEHEKVHSEYSFPCTKCSKTFHTNDALKHHLPLHEDTTKSQCKICFKFITIKSMSKHMSSFHKESQGRTENNNNNISVTSNKSRSRSKSNNSGQEKLHGCNYCKKSFVSPAKLRLHTGKYHAEERLSEPPLHMTTPDHPAMMSFTQSLADSSATATRFFEESQQNSFQASPSSDGLPSQQVPEMELNYINSSPEDISDFGQTKDLPNLSGSGYIPTIHIPDHIPEFDNLQPKMDSNSEISSDAINAFFF